MREEMTREQKESIDLLFRLFDREDVAQMVRCLIAGAIIGKGV